MIIDIDIGIGIDIDIVGWKLEDGINSGDMRAIYTLIFCWVCAAIKETLQL